MPKGKKGGGKKGKGKDKAADVPKEKHEITLMKEKFEQEAMPHWVILHMNLMNWSFMNSDIRIRSESALLELKDRIKAKHGAVTDLKICRGSFAETNELTEDSLTLEEYGFEGALDGQPERRYEVFYDFRPVEHDDPLLLVWNNKAEVKPNPLPPREEADAK
mmetsp:Transcript_21090/g.47575  ORF Transcript_21090/g.47575 Transcript_21090/m.47575 type:complete len:162 (+) Transcript_21090:113-598(+)|eukprot:CAMPEP_0172587486 /NCGR_PEP_ID=MMETSP1068-20121228/6533_1 /TAXON_ID=35684 /ORGANISM="Pseudopedinella elastica, Strain CCMP716" /LENGTH=161 /DNA_ID=CAMNT_0013382527 /DNA_START=127 /DNA_END=615 /DNA_ORIENTATION=-